MKLVVNNTSTSHVSLDVKSKSWFLWMLSDSPSQCCFYNNNLAYTTLRKKYGFNSLTVLTEAKYIYIYNVHMVQIQYLLWTALSATLFKVKSLKCCLMTYVTH